VYPSAIASRITALAEDIRMHRKIRNAGSKHYSQQRTRIVIHHNIVPITLQSRKKHVIHIGIILLAAQSSHNRKKEERHDPIPRYATIPSQFIPSHINAISDRLGSRYYTNVPFSSGRKETKTSHYSSLVAGRSNRVESSRVSISHPEYAAAQ
jgi:hypothetical protein